MNKEERQKAYARIKKEQKTLGKAIRHLKAARKGGWIDVRYELSDLKNTFRHRHVAWSLLKGRKLDQVDSGVDLNMKKVESHLREFRLRLGVHEEAV